MGVQVDNRAIYTVLYAEYMLNKLVQGHKNRMLELNMNMKHNMWKSGEKTDTLN